MEDVTYRIWAFWNTSYYINLDGWFCYGAQAAIQRTPLRGLLQGLATQWMTRSLTDLSSFMILGITDLWIYGITESEPVRSATLHSDGSQDGCNDGGDDLQHLFDSWPFDFHCFTQNLIVSKGHTEITEITEIL